MVLSTSASISRDHGCQGVTVRGIARQRPENEPAALGVANGGGDGGLDAELVRPVSLALANAFDFRRLQGIDFAPALALFVHAPCRHEQLCEHRLEPAGALDLSGDVAESMVACCREIPARQGRLRSYPRWNAAPVYQRAIAHIGVRSTEARARPRQCAA
jgi:hypothetical protein